MQKTVAVIHTSLVTHDVIKKLFEEIIPEVRMVNIVDDGLLQDLIRYGSMTPSVARRVCQYALEAETAGADVLFNQCSSVGEAVDLARKMITIPYVKIDEAMAEEAVKLGSRISVIATSPSTMGPSCRLVERTAAREGKVVQVHGFLVEGAFDALTEEKDRDKHNRLVLEQISRVEDSNDVVILAQGSMIALEPLLGNSHKPVLTSPRLGVLKLKRILENCSGKCR